MLQNFATLFIIFIRIIMLWIFDYHFSPHAWIEYTWNPLTSLERWLSVVGIIFFFLVAELNTFYLKFVLWFPPEHWLNFVRLALVLCWGAVGLRETFQFLGKNKIQYHLYCIHMQNLDFLILDI